MLALRVAEDELKSLHSALDGGGPLASTSELTTAQSARSRPDRLRAHRHRGCARRLRHLSSPCDERMGESPAAWSRASPGCCLGADGRPLAGGRACGCHVLPFGRARRGLAGHRPDRLARAIVEARRVAPRDGGRRDRSHPQHGDQARRTAQAPAPARAAAALGTPTQLSFPSAHATTSFAAAGVYSRLGSPPRRFTGSRPGWRVSRLYLGLHYPSDSPAGAALGTFVSRLMP